MIQFYGCPGPPWPLLRRPLLLSLLWLPLVPLWSPIGPSLAVLGPFLVALGLSLVAPWPHIGRPLTAAAAVGRRRKPWSLWLLPLLFVAVFLLNGRLFGCHMYIPRTSGCPRTHSTTSGCDERSATRPLVPCISHAPLPSERRGMRISALFLPSFSSWLIFFFLTQ
ncbi:hypothetical protein BC940DRAFT_140904 [Gongronella butleri]|nr:hypothetical protein BC940DRAFT_140904 [Gongronella butleri]